MESATENVTEQIGRKIMIFRNDRHMSQKELADKIGVSSAYISYLEKGHRSLSVELLVSIATVLGCKMVNLIPVSQGGRPLHG